MRKSLQHYMGQWVRKLSDAVWFFGEHAFIATLILVLISALIVAILFYQYVIFSPNIEREITTSEFKFQEEVLEELLFELKKEEVRIKQADFLTPRDLFNP